jgi:hypothetical protein
LVVDRERASETPRRSKRNPRPKAAQNPNSNTTYAIAPKERGEKKQGRLTSLEGELIVDNETRAPQSRTALTHRPSRTKLTALTHNTHGTHAQHSRHSRTTLTALTHNTHGTHSQHSRLGIKYINPMCGEEEQRQKELRTDSDEQARLRECFSNKP